MTTDSATITGRSGAGHAATVVLAATMLIHDADLPLILDPVGVLLSAPVIGWWRVA